MSFPKARSSVHDGGSRNIGIGDGGEDREVVMNLIIIIVVTLIFCGGGGNGGVGGWGGGVGGETIVYLLSDGYKLRCFRWTSSHACVPGAMTHLTNV